MPSGSMDRPHRPRDNAPEHLTLLRERFAELGTSARRFLDSLLRDQRCAAVKTNGTRALQRICRSAFPG